MKRTIIIQPAEKHMDKGQIKLTVEHEITEQHSTSSTIYIPEALFVMLPSMVDSYKTTPQKMTANVITKDKDTD